MCLSRRSLFFGSTVVTGATVGGIVGFDYASTKLGVKEGDPVLGLIVAGGACLGAVSFGISFIYAYIICYRFPQRPIPAPAIYIPEPTEIPMDETELPSPARPRVAWV